MTLSKSIRGRLLLWLAFLLVCILSGFGVTAYQLHRINVLSQIDEDLERRVAALSAAVRLPPFFEGRRGGRPPNEVEPEWPPPRGRRFGPGPFRGRPEDHFGPREIRIPAETLSLFNESATNSFYFVIWSPGGTLLRRSTNAPPDLERPERPGPDTTTHVEMRDTRREAFHFTEMGDCVLAGRSIAADLVAIRNFALWLIVAGGSVLALGLSGGWGIASRAIRPVEDISAAASRISAGNLSERIDLADTDSELGRLARVLNSAFARLESAFAQQKQFTADASHELRTPIAVLISEAQTALARERTAGEFRETVEACLDTAQQMRRLTESLLELARFDAGQEPLQRQRFDLEANARECVDLVRPLANQRGIRIDCQFTPVECFGDPDRLGQVITNLLVNAIHYNRDGGEVRVTTQAAEGAAIIGVADTGPGIAADDLPHIFERFYRADKARARSAGRSGLGLSISKSIVDTHGGSIDVATQVGLGTTFTVRIPVDAEDSDSSPRGPGSASTTF